MNDDLILAIARGILSKYLTKIPRIVVVQTSENPPDHDRKFDRDLTKNNEINR